MEKVLEIYFEDLKARRHHSNLSWENCYKFFYENHETIVKNKDNELLEIAALHLAFYLASCGMYRGSAFIRRYDHTVFKELIRNLLTKCENLWNEKVDWEDLKKANEIIKKYFKELKNEDTSKNNEEYKNEPTQTVITKILMGIFGCVPAYDRYFIKALKTHNICQTYNETSFNTLKLWWKKQNYSYKHTLIKDTIEYPPMKLVDVYFWSEGERLNEEYKK